jgi:hypothetical protein
MDATCKYVRLRTCLCQKLMIRARRHAQISVDFKGTLTLDFDCKNRKNRRSDSTVLQSCDGLGGGGGMEG